MQIEQKLSFKETYKKLKPDQKKDVDAALQAIFDNPEIGEQKRGDLAWLRVYKFKMVGQLTLIGYTVDDDKIVLTLIALRTHENFYRNLK